MTATAISEVTNVEAWREEIIARVAAGDRFAAVYPTADGQGIRLTAALTRSGGLDLLDVSLGPRTRGYPALTPAVPGAFWYEREIHDFTGLVPTGHPRLDPLVLPLAEGDSRPHLGAPDQPPPLTPHEQPLAAHLVGTGIFTLPHGPVRSGVVESVEFLIETPGEDIPHLRFRPHHKHRGLAKRFEQLPIERGLMLAERVEGIASVAHALAFAHAVEDVAGIEVTPGAALIRVIHAELERIANHLDVAMRLADAAALAVATARFGWHKERILRLRGQLCGSRFGRGVLAIGAVTGPLLRPSKEVRVVLDQLERDITRDERSAMVTASFLDRLRGTGPLPADIAMRHGALGPIGRASGAGEDVRASRPYDAYPQLGVQVAGGTAGDVQERLRVRWAELHESFRLLRASLEALGDDDLSAGALEADWEIGDGRGVGWAEAPQGEVLYVIELEGGGLRRVAARSASFHNLPLFHTVFAGDIFTDFPFIEASFGLSIAGVAG